MLRETLGVHSSTSRKLQLSCWTVEVISRIGAIPLCLRGPSHLQLLRTRVPSPPHRLGSRGQICSICSDWRQDTRDARTFLLFHGTTRPNLACGGSQQLLEKGRVQGDAQSTR